MKILGLIALSVVAAGAGQLFLKAGTEASGEALSHDALSLAGWGAVLLDWKVLIGLALWGVSTLVYLLVLSRTQLSFAYCLGSINYILVPLASRWVFQENLSTTRLAGMGVIFLGVALTLWGRLGEPGGSP